jgi:hypothetical protein
MGSLLSNIYNRLKAKYGTNDLALFDAIFRGVIDEERIDYALDSFDELGQCGYDEFEDLKGYQNTHTKYGYRHLINSLRNRASSYPIYTDEAAVRIDWSASGANSKVSVFTSKGRTFRADYVICTASLGYLKKNHGQLFYPSLSLEKQTAISKTGFGTVNKMFLIFDKPIFTKPNDGGFQIFWKSDMPHLDSTYSLNVRNIPVIQF